jgi:hypothetical protein
MKLLVAALAATMFASAQEYKIAVIGLVHSHVWGHLPKMVAGKPAVLVGVAETNPELIAEAKKAGVAENLFFADYNKMLDEKKPNIVWSFVDNSRHLEIAKACATRKIHVMYEKPLASTYKDALAIQALAKRRGGLQITQPKRSPKRANWAKCTGYEALWAMADRVLRAPVTSTSSTG